MLVLHDKLNKYIEMATVIINTAAAEYFNNLIILSQQDVSSGGVLLSGQTQRLEGTVEPTETGLSWHLLMGTVSHRTSGTWEQIFSCSTVRQSVGQSVEINHIGGSQFDHLLCFTLQLRHLLTVAASSVGDLALVLVHRLALLHRLGAALLQETKETCQQSRDQTSDQRLAVNSKDTIIGW